MMTQDVRICESSRDESLEQADPMIEPAVEECMEDGVRREDSSGSQMSFLVTHHIYIHEIHIDGPDAE